MKKTLFFLMAIPLIALLGMVPIYAQSTKGISRTKAESTADSGPRTALVIGNAGYATAPLRNPVNDARAIVATLREL